MTGIEPGEDVSIKPARGKFTKKETRSKLYVEIDGEKLPSPNH